jgi:uncharacterized glyoxalase superfamily protein PhnB
MRGTWGREAGRTECWWKEVENAGSNSVHLAQEGSVIMPLTKTYWAEAFGMLTDKFGIRWMVNCETPKGPEWPLPNGE